MANIRCCLVVFELSLAWPGIVRTLGHCNSAVASSSLVSLKTENTELPKRLGCSGGLMSSVILIEEESNVAISLLIRRNANVLCESIEYETGLGSLVTWRHERNAIPSPPRVARVGVGCNTKTAADTFAICNDEIGSERATGGCVGAPGPCWQTSSCLRLAGERHDDMTQRRSDAACRQIRYVRPCGCNGIFESLALGEVMGNGCVLVRVRCQLFLSERS
jgi:hypothetical protein